MYELDGFVYGGTPTKSIKIVDAKPLDDMIMILTFSSGEKRLFDATILNGPVFEPLKEKKIFENYVLEFGVVTWMEGTIDCAPEFMYENSYEYPEDNCKIIA